VNDHAFVVIRVHVTISKYNQLLPRFTSIIRSHSWTLLYQDHSIIASSRHIYMVLFFAHIPFVVNHTFSAMPVKVATLPRFHSLQILCLFSFCSLNFGCKINRINLLLVLISSKWSAI